MKVLLVKPNGIADELIPPVSLGLIAASIRSRHDVEILDAMKEKMDAITVAAYTRDGGYQIVGFQAFTKDLQTIRETCRLIRQGGAHTRTIVGGIHPTMRPRETMQYFGPLLDYAWQGEAELGFGAFLDMLSEGGMGLDLSLIPGLVWRDTDAVRINANKYISDLDAVGIPAWELMPPNTYPEAPHGAFYKHYPLAPITVTRGCPFRCAFCSASKASGHLLRSRSVDSVMSELHMLKRIYGIKEFQIEDDNFTLNREYVVKFCKELIDSGLNMSWSFPNGVRMETLDAELLRLMKQAGCYAINCGIESGATRILTMIQKNQTLEVIREKVKLVKCMGIAVGGFFILGFPGETADEIEQTIAYACSLPLDRIGVSYYQPFPGTALHDDLVRSGEIPSDWAESTHSSLHDLTYIPSSLTGKQLRSYRRKLLTRFYLRRDPVMGMVRQIRSPRHLLYMLKRAIRWYMS